MRSSGKYVFAAFFLCGQYLIAQEYPFSKYTPKDGLLSGYVHHLYQDSRGRIFFMTGTGLSLYDGARFRNYTTSDGLAHPIVNDILEINPDSLLLATKTG